MCVRTVCIDIDICMYTFMYVCVYVYILRKALALPAVAGVFQLLPQGAKQRGGVRGGEGWVDFRGRPPVLVHPIVLHF